MRLRITVDARRLNQAFTKAPRIVERELRVELKEQMQAIQRVARRKHRFKRRTGSLQRSILKEVKQLTGVVYLEEGIANYGYHVHQGQRGWAPDQFVFEAFRSRKTELKSGMNDAMTRAIRKAGLS